jgi:hypothetical protein
MLKSWGKEKMIERRTNGSDDHNPFEIVGHKESVERVLRIGDVIKLLVGSFVTYTVMVVSFILWVQAQGDARYQQKISGENQERQIVEMRDAIKSIASQNDDLIKQNNEISRTLGRIEGYLDKGRR